MPDVDVTDTQEFDSSAALSQRDKKIAEQTARIKELEDQLTAEPNSELGEEETTVEAEGDKSGDAVSPYDDRIAKLENKISQLQQGTFDSQFSLNDRVQDEDFKKWASETKFSPLDPNSPTLENVLMDARESGDFSLANSIIGSYDRSQRASIDSATPATSKAKPKTKVQKDNKVKLDELMKQRKRAMSDGDFDLGKKLNSEISQLKRDI